MSGTTNALNAAGRVLRATIRYAMALAGVAGIAYGAWLYQAALGFVVGGSLLFGLSILDQFSARASDAGRGRA